MSQARILKYLLSVPNARSGTISIKSSTQQTSCATLLCLLKNKGIIDRADGLWFVTDRHKAQEIVGENVPKPETTPKRNKVHRIADAEEPEGIDPAVERMLSVITTSPPLESVESGGCAPPIMCTLGEVELTEEKPLTCHDVGEAMYQQMTRVGDEDDGKIAGQMFTPEEEAAMLDHQEATTELKADVVIHMASIGNGPIHAMTHAEIAFLRQTAVDAVRAVASSDAGMAGLAALIREDAPHAVVTSTAEERKLCFAITEDGGLLVMSRDNESASMAVIERRDVAELFDFIVLARGVWDIRKTPHAAK
jgi:hypothetical protein